MRGLTFIEVLFGLTSGLMLFGILMGMHSAGFRRVSSDDRKLDAALRVHAISERYRRDVLEAVWTVVLPLDDLRRPGGLPTGAPGDEAPALPGASPLAYHGQDEPREFAFDRWERRLYINGEPFSIDDAGFVTAPTGLITYYLHTNRHNQATRLPPDREMTSLVGAIFPQIAVEERLHADHIWEEEHAWCIGSRAVPLGFIDP